IRGIEILEFLLRKDTDCAVSVLATIRMQDFAETSRSLELHRLEHLAGFHRMKLRPLPEAEMSNLVSDLLPLDPQVCRRVAEASQGVAVYAIELIKLWSSEGALEADRDGYHLDRQRAILPRDLNEIWQAQLSAASGLAKEENAELGEQLIGVLIRAAILGQPFTFAALREIADCEQRPELKHAVAKAWAMWHEEGFWQQIAPGKSLFVHQSLREAILRLLNTVQLKHFHQLAAQARLRSPILSQSAEVVAVAAHYEAARLPDEAFPFFIRATREARKQGRDRAALKHIRRAAEQIEACQAGPLDRRWAVVYRSTAEVLLATESYEEAEEVASALVSRAEAWGDPLHRATGLRLLAESLLSRGLTSEVEPLLLESRSLMERQGVQAELASIDLVLAQLWRDTRPPEFALERLRTAMAACSAIGNEVGKAKAMLAAARLHLQVGHADGAESLISTVGTTLRALNDQSGLAELGLLVAEIALTRQRLNDAFEHTERAESLFRLLGSREGKAETTLMKGRVYLANGQLEEAHHCLQTALAEFSALKSRRRAARVHLELNRVAIERGDFRDSLERLRKLFPSLSKTAGRTGEALALMLQARCYAELGAWREAAELLDSGVAIVDVLQLAEPDLARQLGRITKLAKENGQTSLLGLASQAAAAMWGRLGVA
ncbi:MAG: hypothetical protein KC561_12925, partial [Myxococcales bacterium]|nr:hypothetical protein [Myxococcales bacterium]